MYENKTEIQRRRRLACALGHAKTRLSVRVRIWLLISRRPSSPPVLSGPCPISSPKEKGTAIILPPFP